MNKYLKFTLFQVAVIGLWFAIYFINFGLFVMGFRFFNIDIFAWAWGLSILFTIGAYFLNKNFAKKWDLSEKYILMGTLISFSPPVLIQFTGFIF